MVMPVYSARAVLPGERLRRITKESVRSAAPLQIKRSNIPTLEGVNEEKYLRKNSNTIKYEEASIIGVILAIAPDDVNVYSG